MKIKSVTLFNIGPYIDINTFQFSISNDRNIVLLGGKNGAGKTTFLKAIKTCLYGCKVWGYEAVGKEYFSVISGLVNSKSLYDSTAKAYIEIDLYFNDGKQANIYTLHREWKKVKMTFSEFFHVRKNGDIILGQELDDFINYLLSMIPPDMFNFYFFDGEAIAEFFLGAEGNKNFRNAFLKLYGLDTLSIMIDNFYRNIKKTDSQKSSYETFLQSRYLCEIEEKKHADLVTEIMEIEREIDLLQMKLRALQSNYSKDGGIGLAEWKELNASLLKEESLRESINRWLKEVANHYLPFLLLSKQLSSLSSELSISQDRQRRSVMLDTLASDDFMLSIENFLREKNSIDLNSMELIEFFKKLFTPQEEGLDFDFSIKQVNRIFSQIYEKQDFDKREIKSAVLKINASLKKSKIIRERLISSSIDGYEDFITEKERLERTISCLLISLERKKQECEMQKIVYEDALKSLDRAKAIYENFLKDRSIKNIAERSAVAFTIAEEKLILRQSKLLQQEFMKCFTSIINKNSFIDGIIIDSKINVIPYKFISVTIGQIGNYMKLNKDFLALFDNPQFILDINRLEFSEVESIQLPAPMQAPFSQGERQVYIMSLYLALLKTSQKDIPFFIDTPFARIDSDHRSNIIVEFFTKIKNQMFILSTDEEIVGEYKKMLEEKISNTFVLEINNYGTTKIADDKYFGD